MSLASQPPVSGAAGLFCRGLSELGAEVLRGFDQSPHGLRLLPIAMPGERDDPWRGLGRRFDLDDIVAVSVDGQAGQQGRAQASGGETNQGLVVALPLPDSLFRARTS